MIKRQNTSESSVSTATVLIADPDTMRCKLISTGLKRCRYRFNVSACVTDSLAALERLRDCDVDVAVISAKLRDGDLAGLELLHQIRGNHPGVRSVVLIDTFDREIIVKAFRLGADGVFNRDEPFAAFCRAIHAVSQGSVWITADELRCVLDALADQRLTSVRLVDAKGQNLLSKRQDEIVGLVAEGCSNREISEALRLSEHTVKNYMLRIFDKLGVSSRCELVLYAVNSRK